MRILITRVTLLIGTLLFGWSPLASAAIPNGVMVFEFKKGNIYDFSYFQDCETENLGGISITLCAEIFMVPNGKGKHTGTAFFDFSGSVNGLLVGPASASVGGKIGGKGKAKLKFKTIGNLNIPGFGSPKTTVKAKCSGKISSSGFFASVCKLSVKIKKVGTEKAKAIFDSQLNGGLWTLMIDVMPTSAKKFKGTGTDSLGYMYKVNGKYNAKKDTSTVNVTGLKGTPGKGAKAELKGLTDSGAARAKIKVQGYKGSAPVQASP